MHRKIYYSLKFILKSYLNSSYNLFQYVFSFKFMIVFINASCYRINAKYHGIAKQVIIKMSKILLRFRKVSNYIAQKEFGEICL